MRDLDPGEDGRELPAGEEGEICVGPGAPGAWAGQYTPMLGYWNRPDATARRSRAASITPATSACSSATARCSSAAAATS
jgi:acyl-CoA synthetase (AMP-forming)/AMP-acid ligase II